MIDHVEVQRHTYHDSVRLMQASAAVQAAPGIEAALIAMGTDLNLELLADLGFDLPGDLTADDMVVALRARDDPALAAGLAALEGALRATPGSAGDAAGAPSLPPRTVAAAAGRSGADLALISVPGPHAYVEAAAALEAGLHVMVFSDNVPIHQEIDLKRRGSERGRLVMGPDCGTAIIGGVGLGFANAVRPGPVGIVGASGTGTQQLCCLLDEAGTGIRHALGTGSRDLSGAVGGLSTLQGLAALDRDPGTEVIIVVSKPPDPDVAARVREAAEACATPAVICFVGRSTLEEGAAAALAVLGLPPPRPGSWPGAGTGRSGALRGLFSGGTHRDEARMVVAAELGTDADGVSMIDLGSDEYTRGRPHPMIDQRLLLDFVRGAAADPTVGVILLDVVLGHGSHPEPAAGLAPVVGGAVEDGVAVVVSLCGTEFDPQGRDLQATVLHEAGAAVFLGNAAAARYAAALVAR